MLHLYRLLSGLLLTSLLVSCATRQGPGDEIPLDETAIAPAFSTSYKYDAWQPDASGEFVAINVLLTESDTLIDDGAYNAASDKLERALRIKPKYAPAWSRLSWLALQTKTPKRAIQLAKRSNSFAYSAPKLQLLNWSFIRTASKVLQDKTLYLRANQKIETLQSF